MAKNRAASKPRYASPQQVADTVGGNLSPITVRRWCQQGRVVARKHPGDGWRVEVDAEGWPVEPAFVDQTDE